MKNPRYYVSKTYDRSTSQVATRLIASQLSDTFGRTHDEILQLMNGQELPIDCSSIESFRSTYCSSALLSKAAFIGSPQDRSGKAIEKFLLSEEKCRETNHRLLTALSPNQARASLLLKVRGKIRRVLRSFSWNECSRHFGFGPGASVGIRRRNSDSYYKFGAMTPTCTSNNYDLGRCAILSHPLWASALGLSGQDTPNIEIVSGNVVTTVPKNWKIDRVIATEPLLNMYIQKGIGAVIRRRLKSVGVNLDSQYFNQEAARVASKLGNLATVDLSAASDSISIELVRLLLPSEWCEALELCRSPRGVLPSGEVIYYQKISSMGNGYTFELESLIFWAICSVCVDLCVDRPSIIAVYGDDLIVPLEAYPLLEDLLSYCGFTVNAEKSHAGGMFHESCGKHFFCGADVTPIYIKRLIDSDSRLFWAANSVSILAMRMGSGWCRDAALKPCFDFIRSMIPVEVKSCVVPTDFMSEGIWSSWDEALPKRHKRFEGWSFKTLRRLKTPKVVSGPALLPKALSCPGPTPEPPTDLSKLAEWESPPELSTDEIPLSVNRWTIRKSFIHQWSGPPPWV